VEEHAFSLPRRAVGCAVGFALGWQIKWASRLRKNCSKGVKTCQGTDLSRLPRRAVGAAKLLKMNNSSLPKATRSKAERQKKAFFRSLFQPRCRADTPSLEPL